MIEQLSSYLKLLQARNYSATRIYQTKEVVEKLIVFCKSKLINSWSEVNSEILEEFFLQQSLFVTRRGNKRAAMTLSCWKSSLRRFFLYLLNNRQILKNPASDLKVKREKVTAKTALSYTQICKLLEVPNIEKKLGLRDRALMELLYATGMRISEANKLNLYDLNLTDKEVILRKTKTKKERLVPLTKESILWLEKYLIEVHNLLSSKKKTPENALFLSLKGQRMTTQAMQLNIREYGAKIGLKISSNTFRHTLASHLLEAGANILDIQRILGHSSLYNTQFYSHVASSSLKQVIEKANKN